MAIMPLHSAEANPDRLMGILEEGRAWICAQASRGAPLHEVERGLQALALEVGRLLLAEYVGLCGVGDLGAGIEVTRQVSIEVRGAHGERVGGGEMTSSPVVLTHRRLRSCKYLSLFGEIEIPRMAYGQRGQQSVMPLDEQLAVPARLYSYPLQEKWVTGIARGPFQEATKSLKEATGQHVAIANADEVLLDAATDFDAFYESRPVPPPKTTPPIQVAIVDGKGISIRARVEEAAANHVAKDEPRRGTTEQANVAVVYNIDPYIRTPDDILKECDPGSLHAVPPRPRPQNKRLWASLTRSKEEIFASVADEMLARDPSHQKLWVCVMDGDKALRRMARKVLGALGPFVLILDLFHVLEYLWDAANALHGKTTPEARQWCTERLADLLVGKASAVARGMRQSATKRGLTGEKRDAIDAAAGYFLANKDSMQYHEYLAAGLPIGSGAGEGAVRHLINDRLERTGMHWSVVVAEAVLKMRAVELSGDTEDYWPFHIAHEQGRLHGNRTLRAL